MSDTEFLPKAFHRGKFVPFSDANVSIATHSLHYATSLFGGLRTIEDPQKPGTVLLYRIDRHAKRLSDGAKYLKYEISPEYIAEKIIELIKINNCTKSVYIRPLIYQTYLGIYPCLHKSDKDLAIYGLILGDYMAPGAITCRFSSWVRQEDASLPLRGKMSSSYLTSSMAKTEAFDSGFDEAIMLNRHGKVSEASAMNIFLVRNGKLITPSSDQDILEGITRDSVIQVAEDEGIDIEIRPVDKTELYLADEVFLTGSAAKLVSVGKLEGHTYSSETPVTGRLLKRITDIVENRDEKFSKEWVTEIKL